MTNDQIALCAYSVLINFGIKKLPVNLMDIISLCDDLEIETFREFSRRKNKPKQECIKAAASDEGAIFARIQGADKQFRILYNEDKKQSRVLFTVAHELGHYFLRHSNAGIGYMGDIEREADMFASQLLMPHPVLKAIGVPNEQVISSLCKTGAHASSIAFKRLRGKLEEFQCPYLVDHQMKEFIDGQYAYWRSVEKVIRGNSSDSLVLSRA